ncbi:MAG: hypothetical protein IPJ09_13045 [Saprospiraceae bacterium]|nr:hypothetical protein [Saprospiraceae bacterium]
MWFPHKRYEWNIFISNTDDVRDPTQDQPIMKELNMRSSLGSTIRQKSEKKILLNPSFYQCAIFMPAAEVQEMIRRTKADYSYYTHLMQMDGSYRSIWDAWRFKDSARAIIDRLVATREDLVKNYETGDGTFQLNTRYWYGVRNFKIMTMTVAGLFADRSILLTAKERTSLEQLVGMLARIVWDDNNVPIIDSAGVNMGRLIWCSNTKIQGVIFSLC